MPVHHDVARADQGDGSDAVRLQPRADFVDDMEHRDGDGRGDVAMDLVHRIGADEQALGAAGLQSLGAAPVIWTSALSQSLVVTERARSAKSTLSIIKVALCSPP